MTILEALGYFSRKRRRARRAARRAGVTFVGGWASFAEAAAAAGGYDAAEILDKVLEATRQVVSGEAVHERDSVLFDEIEYAWPVTAGLMLAAARANGRLTVLDFGGALGSSCLQNRRILAELPSWSWGVVEQANFVAAGRAHVAFEGLSFHEDIAAAAAALRPDVVLASSVLQYLDEPMVRLDELLAVGADVLLLDRTPFLLGDRPTEVRLQRVRGERIYEASYPCWFFREADLVGRIEAAGYRLVESFPSLDRLAEDAAWKGHLFVRR